MSRLTPPGPRGRTLGSAQPSRRVALLGTLGAAITVSRGTRATRAAAATLSSATVDLGSVVQRTDPYAIGVVSSTYGATPLSSATQAAIEEKLDARYVRVPVGFRDGRVTTSAAGAGTSLDVAALVRWYRSKGFRVIAVIGGRTNDVDVQAGDATRIVRALGTDGVVYSTPNEPTNQGWNLDQQLRAAQMIVAEGRAVVPGFTLWGPTWSHYSRGTFQEFARRMGSSLGGIDYHHYAMGERSLSTAASLAATPDYGREVREVRGDLRALGLPERVSIDELNYSWRFQDGTGSSGENTRFFTAVNTVWMASALGHLLVNGGSGAVYATQNGPLGVTVQAGARDQGRPAGSPMPAFWGIAAWTGAKTFSHFEDDVYAVGGQNTPAVETFAVANEAGGVNLVLVNKSENTAVTHQVTLPGAAGRFTAHQTDPAKPYEAPGVPARDVSFDGSVSLTLPAMTVTTVVLTLGRFTSSTPALPAGPTRVADVAAGGPVAGWTAPTGLVTGGGTIAKAGTVSGLPAGVPAAVFDREHYGDQRWRIKVPAGRYDVELLFAEKWSAITGAGQRTFSVRLNDTTTIEPALDVFARAGGRNRVLSVRGTVTSREYVTVELRNGRGNAILNGIRITAR
jgi:hypothetical protein